MDVALSCWRDLDTCRELGFGVGPIPWTAIIAWADVIDLDRDATWLLCRVIRKLDSDYLAGIAAKRRLTANEE